MLVRTPLRISDGPLFLDANLYYDIISSNLGPGSP